MLVEVETFDEWAARHSIGEDKVIKCDKSGQYLCPDGASANIDSGGGVFREPPTDPSERLTVVARYWRARLRRAQENFDNTKAKFLRMCSDAAAGPQAATPPDHAREILETLARTVVRIRAKWNVAERARQDTPEMRSRLAWMQEQMERGTEMQMLGAELMSISPATIKANGHEANGRNEL